MDCYICKSEASLERSTGDFDHIKCCHCGEYIITVYLLKIIKKDVDIEAMQDLLNIQRSMGDKIPVITSFNIKYK